MKISTGNNKTLKVNIAGQTYKVMNPVLDYARLILNGTKTLEELPESIRAQVEVLVNKLK